MSKKLSEEERKILQQDILDRYDNEEYWDYDVLIYLKAECKKCEIEFYPKGNETICKNCLEEK